MNFINSNTLLKKATQIVEDNISETNLDVNFLASEMCLGRTSLYYKFKGVTGLTPNEFIVDTKLMKGLDIFRNEPHITISEVTYRLGFNEPSYFIHLFKKKFGITPGEYRKLYLAY